MTDVVVRPSGEIVIRKTDFRGDTLILVTLPDPQAHRQVELEFRLSDFVAFADYIAMVAGEQVRELSE